MSFDSAFGSLTLLLFFLVPGFISIKVYDLLVPGERRDFSKAILQVAAYGAINYALLFGAFLKVMNPHFAKENPHAQWVYLACMLLVAPIVWPVIWLGLRSIPFVQKRTVPAVAKPWDDFFFTSQKTGEKFWVIVHLRDGRKVVGKYGERSFASTGAVP